MDMRAGMGTAMAQVVRASVYIKPHCVLKGLGELSQSCRRQEDLQPAGQRSVENALAMVGTSSPSQNTPIVRYIRSRPLPTLTTPHGMSTSGKIMLISPKGSSQAVSGVGLQQGGSLLRMS